MFTGVFWKKAWAWIKHHWQLLAIVLGVALAFLFRKRPNEKLLTLMDKQKESYEKEINLIKKTNEEKEARKEEIFKSHEKEVEDIEKQHDSAVVSLEEEKQKEIEEMTEKYKERPDELAKRIASILSAEYIKSEWKKKSKE
jgi:gas vesicle protein